MNRRLSILMILIALILLNGCDPYAQDDYESYYVVESYLIANRDLPQVKVSKTLPIEEPYRFEAAALDDASVQMQQLDANGAVEQTFAYHLEESGIYRPDQPVRVTPEQRYRLKVAFSNGNSVQAETLVPGDFHQVGTSPDTTVYQSPQQVAVNISPSYYPGRQSYYIFTVNVINPTKDQLTPFYKDIFDEEKDSLSDYYINSSGIINEKNYDENDDGSITLKLPWLSVAFYGDNDIVANAIDDNMYDFLRSQDVQTGGSTLPPGQIQNVIYHVEGGIGILGSMASDTVSVYIKRGG